MLHTVVQHKHVDMNAGNFYIQSCQQETGFLAFLRHAFELDRRENHLEDVEIEDTDFHKIDLIPSKDSNLISEIANSPTGVLKWSFVSTAPLKSHKFSQLTFRGPPLLV